MNEGESHIWIGVAFSSHTFSRAHMPEDPMDHDDDDGDDPVVHGDETDAITAGMQVLGSTSSFLFNCFENTYPGNDVGLKNVLLCVPCLGVGMASQLLSSHRLIQYRAGLMDTLQHASNCEDGRTVRMRSSFDSGLHEGLLHVEKLTLGTLSKNDAGKKGFFSVQVHGLVERVGEQPEKLCCRDARSLTFEITAYDLEDAEACKKVGLDAIKEFFIQSMMGRRHVLAHAFQVHMQNGTVQSSSDRSDRSWRLMMDAYVIFQKEHFLMISNIMDLKSMCDPATNKQRTTARLQWQVTMSIETLLYTEVNALHAACVIQKVASHEGASWERIAEVNHMPVSPQPCSKEEVIEYVQNMCKRGSVAYEV